MGISVREIATGGKTVWMNIPAPDNKFITKIQDYTVLLLMEKLFIFVDKEIASEIILCSGENLGKIIYSERVQTQPKTPKEWVDIVNTKIFSLMGTNVEYEKITDTDVFGRIISCPTPLRKKLCSELACAFSYGFGRGIWRSAFPKGEMFMYKTTGEKGCFDVNFVIDSKTSQREEIKSMIQNIKIMIEGGLRLKEDYEPMEHLSLVISDIAIVSITDTIFKYLEKEQASEVIMQASERLGEIVFEENIQDITDWTTKKWVDVTSEKIWNKQGTGLVFSEITDNKISAHVFKCPTPDRAGKAPHIACPMSWCYVRGIWKKTYPDGEILMRGTMAHGAPTCEFIWYTKITPELIGLREKTKKYLTREEEIRML